MAIIQKRISSMKERSKEGNHKKVDKKKQSLGLQQHSRGHHRFLPLMSENFYNCEFCGVGIAVIQIVSVATAKDNSRLVAHVLNYILTRKQ
jgi:hypothetical protein